LQGDKSRNLVIPAQAGIQGQRAPSQPLWIPAFAGMTELVVWSASLDERLSESVELSG
jgi:hypothetical protein